MNDAFPPGWGSPAGPSGIVGGAGSLAPDGRMLVYAGFWIRTAAALLDSFLLGLSSILFGIFTLPHVHFEQWQGDTPSYQVAYTNTDLNSSFAFPMPQIDVPDHGSYLAIYMMLYFILMEASPLQGTLGKLALGLRVSTLHGNRISFLQSLIRTVIKTFVSFPLLYIGVLMVAFTPRKQGLHDLVARTLVLRRERVACFDG